MLAVYPAAGAVIKYSFICCNKTTGKMASPWAFAPPPVSDKPPLPNGIPEAWQKALEALQATSPKSNIATKSTPATPEKTAPTNSEYNSPFMPGWQPPLPPPPMCYPGFSGYPPAYPPYYYCPPQQWNPTSPWGSNRMPTAPVADIQKSEPPRQEETVKSAKANSNSFQLGQRPPPPPPSSPPVKSSYYGNMSQAPGSGGIKFNLPKKKPNMPANKNSQALSIQQRMQNFSNGNSFKNVAVVAPVQGAQNVIAASPDDYPPSLRKYVERCFEKCKTDIDKDQIEIILKGKLTRAQQEGKTFTLDWDNEPLPLTHSDRLEQEALEKKITSILKSPENIQKKTSPSNSRLFYIDRHRRSRSRSRSYSRSRSRSRTPPRTFRRMRRSSSSNSSEDSRGFRRTLSSSVSTPEPYTPRNNTPYNKKNKKNKRKGSNKKPFTVDSEFCTDERLQKRAARFETKSPKKIYSSIFTNNTPTVMDLDGDDMQWMSDAVMGTCQNLEKRFFRLTGAVDPTTVRPIEVLTKSLAMVKKHWVEKLDYHYACEQLKSIRQDLVVQCIRNKFTVQVYETHARIALEKGDHTEFNQCQSQLKVLFQEVNEGNRLEFTGYHILYTMFSESAIELKNLLADIKPEEKDDEVVSHALKMAKACSSNNYHRFFRLYLSAPKMSAFIVDWFIERIRKAALKAVIKSFRPNIPVSHIQSALAFPSMEDCVAFLTKLNLVFVDPGVINCKDSVGQLANF
ncbi:hypothetical protein JTE90_005480 [Oedothorax gibbosus]|uniref:PCI domain-containing protein n=1 Tax=Oedothorax gibbosus TaxID=931172 RepID=A0AAV6UNS0_9ARAC|nr:hypothetical protein JTE90_005480 [Oedothorax gibbosus]